MNSILKPDTHLRLFWNTAQKILLQFYPYWMRESCFHRARMPIKILNSVIKNDAPIATKGGLFDIVFCARINRRIYRRSGTLE
jgi:hypothetical protein